jgi:hypothetical protein
MQSLPSASAPDKFGPAAVLGVPPEQALELMAGRRVTPGEVESVALSTYEWWRHLRDPRSYWVTTSQAARLLHLSPSVVRRMLEADRIPHVVHSSGVRLMRRHDLVGIVARITAGAGEDEPEQST